VEVQMLLSFPQLISLLVQLNINVKPAEKSSNENNLVRQAREIIF